MIENKTFKDSISLLECMATVLPICDSLSTITLRLPHGNLIILEICLGKKKEIRCNEYKV